MFRYVICMLCVTCSLVMISCEGQTMSTAEDPGETVTALKAPSQIEVIQTN